VNKLLKLQQVAEADKGAPLAEDDVRILSGEVRPLPGNQVNAGVVGLQQQALAIRRGPLTNAHELPSPQRMERMRDPHKVSLEGGMGCILS